MESTDIAIAVLAIATLINARNVDWKSKKTYKVAAITLNNDGHPTGTKPLDAG